MKEHHIKTFMGADFSFDDKPRTNHMLALELRKWAEEIEDWGDVGIAEAVMINDQLQVTLNDGIIVEDACKG